MADSFDWISLIAKFGLNLADNLFSKKLKEKDVDRIIKKHASSLQHREFIKERLFVVLSGNNELITNEKGEICIKNTTLTKKEFEERLIDFLQMKIEKPKPEFEFVEPEVKEPLPFLQRKSEQEKIEQIKNKHKMLYGE